MATFLRWQFLSKICFASFTTRYLLDESNNRRRSQQRRSIIDGSPFKKKKKYKRDAVSQREKIGRVLLSGSFVSSLLAASPINPFFSHHLHVCRTIIHNIALWCVLVYFYNSYWHKLQTRTVNYFFTFLFPFRFFLFFFPPHRCNKIRSRLFFFFFFSFRWKSRSTWSSSFECTLLFIVGITIYGKTYYSSMEKKKKNRFDRIEFIAHFTLARIRTYIYIYLYVYFAKRILSSRNAMTRHDTNTESNRIKANRRQRSDYATIFPFFSPLFIIVDTRPISHVGDTLENWSIIGYIFR